MKFIVLFALLFLIGSACAQSESPSPSGSNSPVPSSPSPSTSSSPVPPSASPSGSNSPVPSPAESSSPSASSSPALTPTPSPSPSTAPNETVLATLYADPNFSHLKAALSSSTDPTVQQLVARLSDTAQTTTIFAPDNTALPEADGTITASYLEYSLVAGSQTLAEGQLLSSLWVLSTLGNQSQQLQVTKNGDSFVVNGATVQGNTAATNGQIYRISTNLTVPQPLWTVVQGAAATLTSLVKLAGVEAALNVDQRTGFAPSDAAFQQLPDYVNNYLTLNETSSNALLAKLLAYHLGAEVFYWAKQATNSSQTLTTVEGQTVRAAVGPTRQYTVNAVNVQTADILASNGAANLIDQVLIPTDLGFTVANVLEGLPQLAAYVSALKSANLFNQLGGPNAFTVFVPTGNNFTSVNLNYTIVPGTFDAASLQDGQVLSTLSVTAGSLHNKPQVLRVSRQDNNVFVQNVQVARADLGVGFATNGVVHLLADALPAPGSVADIAAQIPQLSTLDEAIVLSGLSGALSAPAGLTVFAPSNDAFAQLPASVWGYLRSNYSQESNAALAQVLKYHAYGLDVLYWNLTHGNLQPPMTLQMLSGGNVNVSAVQLNNKTVVEVNENAVVTLADIPASNGVVHVVSNVLVPSDVNVTNVDLLVGLNDLVLIDALNKTGILANLTSLSVTLFAPTDAAFNKISDQGVLNQNSTSLQQLLLNHVVHGVVRPSDLVNNKNFTTLNNKTLVVSTNDNKTFTVNLAGASTAAGTIDLAASSSNLGTTTPSYVYSINQVLGQGNSDDSGLTSTEIGLIVAGCIVAVLLAGAFVGGAVWYWKRRHGYEQIDGDTF